MSVKKIPNGDFYYFNRYGNTEIKVTKDSKNQPMFRCNNIMLPKELSGKKIRIKVELLK